MADNKEKTLNKNVKVKKPAKLLEIGIAIVLCAVVLVIFLSNFDLSDWGGKKKGQGSGFEQYVIALEDKIASIISDIEGVGKASVAITFETGVEKIYAYETTNTSTGSITEIVLYQGEPIVLKELAPIIKGVVVVAKGASNAVVRLNIVRTVQTLLGIPYNQIEVFTHKT